jgi:5-methylcytosine-specific restriction endonuclease McrA
MEYIIPNIGINARVLVRDGFTCRYCNARFYLAQTGKVLAIHRPGSVYRDPHERNEPLKRSGATFDHIIPEDGGGYDTFENLVVCCVVCIRATVGEREALAPVFRWILGWRK